MKSSMEYEAVEKYENMPDAVSSEVVKFDSFEEIEDIIMDLETNLSQIEEKMNGVTDFKEIDELSKHRDELYEKWESTSLELAELEEE